MRRDLLVRFACLFTLLLVNAAFPQVEALQQQESYFAQAMKDWDAPGMAIAVVRDDKVVFAREPETDWNGLFLARKKVREAVRAKKEQALLAHRVTGTSQSLALVDYAGNVAGLTVTFYHPQYFKRVTSKQ